jgi:hypothetical protein
MDEHKQTTEITRSRLKTQNQLTLFGHSYKLSMNFNNTLSPEYADLFLSSAGCYASTNSQQQFKAENERMFLFEEEQEDCLTSYKCSPEIDPESQAEFFSLAQNPRGEWIEFSGNSQMEISDEVFEANQLSSFVDTGSFLIGESNWMPVPMFSFGSPSMSSVSPPMTPSSYVSSPSSPQSSTNFDQQHSESKLTPERMGRLAHLKSNLEILQIADQVIERFERAHHLYSHFRSTHSTFPNMHREFLSQQICSLFEKFSPEYEALRQCITKGGKDKPTVDEAKFGVAFVLYLQDIRNSPRFREIVQKVFSFRNIRRTNAKRRSKSRPSPFA